MGKLVFLDSSGLIAYFVSKDAFHTRAVSAVRNTLRTGGRFLTTNYVFDEVVTRVRRRGGYIASRRVGDEIFKSKVITRIYIDQEMEASAWGLYEKYHDHELSFTDVVSFAVMNRAGLQEVLTFDDDFKRIGYTIVTGNEPNKPPA